MQNVITERDNLSPDEKRALLARVLREKARQSKLFPLSFAQERMWFLDQLEPDSAFYNVASGVRLTGKLDVGALERTLSEVVRRHEVLRTTFPMVGGVPVQRIAAAHSLRLEVEDLSRYEEAERAAEVLRLGSEEAQRPFNLAQGPMLRVRLLKLNEEEHVVLLAMHHIVADGWSMGVLNREVAAIYEAFKQGQPSPLPELPIQYADFAVWQREWLRGDALAEQLAYWREQLEGAPPVLELPTDRPRPAAQSYRGANHSFRVSDEVSAALKALSRGEGVTLFMTLLAAFKVLLSRYSGQSDISVGTDLAGRNRAEIEPLIGFFINALVLRTEVRGEETFTELLKREREVCLGGYGHGDVPFEKLVEELNPERSLSHSPLFQVSFSLNNVGREAHSLRNTGREAAQLPGLTLGTIGFKEETAKFDLTLSMLEGDGKFAGVMEYNTDLFDEATIRRMAMHFQQLLANIVAHPEMQISRLPLLSEQEREQQLIEWNDTAVDYPRHLTLHQLFEAQAERTAHAIALVYEAEQASYAELNERANRLAHYLRELGVEPESLVGVCFDRSIEMVVSLLAVLKAGAAYVPLDPQYPHDRLSFMMQNAGVSVLLTHSNLADVLPAGAAQVIEVDLEWELISQSSGENLAPVAAPDNLAYVIYTSGSTGTPKGAMISHRSLVNFSLAIAQQLELRASDRMLQFASFSFDVFAEEVFPVWSRGGAVVLVEAGWLAAGVEFTRMLERQAVTGCELPTAFWHEWMRELTERGEEPPESLRFVIIGGENPLPERVAQWQSFNVELWNAFGLTETSITSTMYLSEGNHQMQPEERANQLSEMPIGKPVANTQVYVLDTQMQIVPVGVMGELYLGGEGLARGYWHRPEQTAERFVPHPFSTTGGARLYRTGDVVRYLPEGNLEFIGRGDEQVKVRGFRIELGEIESVLSTHTSVSECVVAVFGQADEKRLVAYVVVAEAAAGTEVTTVESTQLRAYLKERLPDYMVPATFVTLTEIPLTPNGKVDRKALLEPERSEAGGDYVAARTPVEEVLCGVWEQVLKVEQVGVQENFFELGGHSLLATQVISRIREAFSVELALRVIFESPTIAEQALRVEAARRGGQGVETPPLTAVERRGDLPLSFAQERMWFLDQLEPESAFYNVASGVRLTGKLDVGALERTLSEVVRRHEVLRTTFPMVAGVAVQRVAAAVPVHLSVEDLSEREALERAAEVLRLGSEEAQRPFNLAQGPMLRVRLLKLNEEEHVVLFTTHHIISDGWSMGVLVKEVSAIYSAFQQGEPSPLPELAIQYADFAVWQREWLQGDALEQQLSYWREQLRGAPPVLELPTDRPRPAVQSYRGASHFLSLPEELTSALKALSRGEGVTLFMTLLAAFKVLLSRYSGQSDISVGTDLAGRNRAEIEPLIGFFINALVLRTQVRGEETFTELLKREREVCLGGYGHGDVPFEKLVEELNPERSLSHSPLFQVSFNMDYGRGQSLEMSGLTLGGTGGEDKAAKFDLTLGMMEAGGIARGSFEYSTDLFDEATIERMATHFQQLLANIVAHPEMQISRLPLLSEQEREQQLIEWNDTAITYPRHLTLHELFEAQAVATPDALALIYEDEQVTYAELNEHANRLAHYLRESGVAAETRVGVLMERSIQMMAALLGVLKAGGAYVPLDPQYPHDRLSFMVQDAGVSLLLTHSQVAAAGLQQLADEQLRVVELDREWELISQSSGENLAPVAAPDNLAYVIYTSGSTGTPKGAMISHRSLVNFSLAIAQQLELRASDRMLQFASFSFDVFAEEVFPVWSRGGAVVLVESQWLAAGVEFTRMLERQAVTGCELPTAFWHEWMRELTERGEEPPESLRFVIIGGENALRDRVKGWKQFGIPLINAYGLTEVTVTSIVYTMEADSENETWWEFPIGRPVANTQAYILDEALQPVPVGTTGELYIGGEGLGRGYFNRPEQTAERFVPHPFSTVAGARLYKTGDLVRYLADGNIENLGRIDFQVKVRGFRVELGEIETALGQYPAVRESIVLARGLAGSDKRLVAYVVCDEAQTPGVNELKAYLRDKLPDYMLPSIFVFMSAMPLTPNGKVDRRALPDPEQTRPELESEYCAARTEVESTLTEMWMQLLGLERVGIFDNFFDLGGHSLLATQMVSRIRETLGVELPLRTVFESPTIARLAESIENADKASQENVEDFSKILESLEQLSDEETRALLEAKLGAEATTTV